MTTVLDTNALMMPVETDVRLFEELERLGATDYVVPQAVVDELEALAEGTGEEASAASVGLDLLEDVDVEETDADFADDAVVELATGGAGDEDTDAEGAPGQGADGDRADYAVTNDRPLRDRLLAESVSVIGLRGGTKLAITRP